MTFCKSALGWFEILGLFEQNGKKLTSRSFKTWAHWSIGTVSWISTTTSRYADFSIVIPKELTADAAASRSTKAHTITFFHIVVRYCCGSLWLKYTLLSFKDCLLFYCITECTHSSMSLYVCGLQTRNLHRYIKNSPINCPVILILILVWNHVSMVPVTSECLVGSQFVAPVASLCWWRWWSGNGIVSNQPTFYFSVYGFCFTLLIKRSMSQKYILFCVSSWGADTTTTRREHALGTAHLIWYIVMHH